MDNIEKRQESLREVWAENPNIREEILDWSISYNKRADMVTLGKDFPIGSFYMQVEEGVMLRVDSNKKIYGVAIENAKSFVKKNPIFSLPLSVVMHPYRFRLVILPTFYVLYQVTKGLMIMKSKLAMSDYVAARAVLA